MLKNKNIAVYITGGIAVYKVATLVRLLIKEGANVRVAMSDAAIQFVTPLTFQVLTKNKVHTDTFDEEKADEVQHIHLADWTDLALIVPTTANTMAKMAVGMADNFVTSALLATVAPKIVIPAMNEHMWENAATQRNLIQLRQDGIIVMEPATGFLAEGYNGKGRLPEPEAIVEYVKLVVTQREKKQILAGKKVLITAGGTKERIDPVRFISNDSSGKMGYALAKVAVQLGAEVTLVSATKSLSEPLNVSVQYVESAKEMHEAVMKHFPAQDIAVMVAAVSDYRVKNRAEQKMKKTSQQEEVQLTLVKNPDILYELGHSKKESQVVIGFAAETQNVLEYASEKLRKKQADYIIANDVSNSNIGFNADNHQVTILSKSGEQLPLPEVSKENLAEMIWQTLFQ